MPLTREDILHYQRMINVLDGTQHIMQEIDEIIDL